MNRDEAREALQDRGIRFDEKRIFKYLESGDAEVVELFLDAGVKPTVARHNSESAILVAARSGHHGLVKTLLARGASSKDLVHAMSSRRWFDRIATRPDALSFFSGLLVSIGALVGWLVTQQHNEHQMELSRQQNQIAEMQTIETMIPHLVESEESKQIALVAISLLASADLARQLAELLGGEGSVGAARRIPGSVNTLERMAAEGSRSDQPLAMSAIIELSAGTSEDASTARASLASLFPGKKKVLDSLLSDEQEARVLWVDDRPENNVYERRFLERLRIEFDLKTSTDEALALLGKQRYDAVISDMGRPPDPRAGYTLLDALRKSDDQTPFLIYAGSNLPEHKAEALRRGAQGSTNQPRELFESVLEAIASGEQ